MQMRRWLALILGIILAVAALAIAGGSLWLNTFIHSDSFRSDIEDRASRSLGGTVKIEQIDFGILSGIRLEGLASQIDAAHINGQGALIVNVARVRCGFSWLDLLTGQLKLTGLTLEKPQIVLTREATPPADAPTPSAPTAPETSTQASGPVTSGAGKAPPFQFSLDRARLSDGAIAVRDASGNSMVDLQGVDLVADTAGYMDGKDVTGSLKVATVTLPSGPKLTDFSTPFNARIGAFEAKSFAATLCGGNMAGDYAYGSPSILNLNLKGTDIAKLSAAFHPDAPSMLTGSLDLQSKWRGVETGNIDGEGDAQVTDGRIQGVRILDQLSQLLRVNELHDPVIKEAHSHFLVADRETRFTGLELTSDVFRLTGDGTVGFDGSLHANLVLILPASSMDKLPKETHNSFVAQSDGSGSIAFEVTGTTSNPQTDLPARLLMQNLQIKNVLNKALNKFFH